MVEKEDIYSIFDQQEEEEDKVTSSTTLSVEPQEDKEEDIYSIFDQEEETVEETVEDTSDSDTPTPMNELYTKADDVEYADETYGDTKKTKIYDS